MRAILVKEFGDAEVMQVGEVRVPEPGRDEIRVRILAAGVAPWDVEQRLRRMERPAALNTGSRVRWPCRGRYRRQCGFQDGTPVYGWPGPGGCYAQYVTCDVERLAPIPAGLRVTDAAAVPVDALTVDQGITDVLAVGAGDRVLITPGAGGPGHFAVQMARARGAVVVATELRDHELAHKLGAAVVVDQTAPDRPDQVRKVTDGGPEKVLACSASSLPGAARAARDDAITATPVKGRASRSRPGPLGNV